MKKVVLQIEDERHDTEREERVDIPLIGIPAERKPFNKRKITLSVARSSFAFSLLGTALVMPSTLLIYVLRSFRDGLSGSYYVTAVWQSLIDPPSTMLTVAANATGVAFGKSQNNRLSIEERIAAEEEIGDVFRQSSLIALLFTVPCTVVLVSVGPLLRAIGQPPGPVKLADDLLKLSAIGAIPQLLIRAQSESLMGIGRISPSLIIMSVNGVLNFLFSYFLMKGIPGAPQVFSGIGYNGFVVGLNIASWCSELSMLGYLLLNKKLAPYRIFQFKFNRWDIFKSLLTTGVPMGVRALFEDANLFITSLFLGFIDAQYLNQSSSLSSSSSLSLSTSYSSGELPVAQARNLAAAQIVGQYLNLANIIALSGSAVVSANISCARGEKNFYKGRFIGRVGYAYGFVTAAPFIVVFCALPKYLTELFADDPQIMQITRFLFIIQAGNLALDVTRTYSTHALRAFDETMSTMLTSLLTITLFIGSSWLYSGPLALGAIGIFLGRTTGLFSAASILSIRWGRLINNVIRKGFFGRDETQRELSAAGQIQRAPGSDETLQDGEKVTQGRQGLCGGLRSTAHNIFSCCSSFFSRRYNVSEMPESSDTSVVGEHYQQVP